MAAGTKKPTGPPTGPPATRIRSVDKVVDILDLLAGESRGLPLGEIADRLGLNVSTVHHLLATLRHRGLIVQDERSRAYRIGYRLVGLVNRFLAESDLYPAAIGAIQRLRDASGETSYLSAFQDGAIAEVISLTGVRPIQVRRVHRPGQSSLHSTATGKLLLAHLPPAEAAALLAAQSLTPFTPNTRTDPGGFGAELSLIRARGYSLDAEEDYLGVMCVAAPVFAAGGDCVASVSVSYPASPPARTGELIDMVATAAAAVSANLGAVPARPAAFGADGHAAGGRG